MSQHPKKKPNIRQQSLPTLPAPRAAAQVLSVSVGLPVPPISCDVWPFVSGFCHLVSWVPGPFTWSMYPYAMHFYSLFFS